MNNIFFVTSALNVNSGILPSEQRLIQTIDTAKSIKRYAKNPRIILLEGGRQALSLEQRDALKHYYDDILDFTWHPTIIFAHDQKVNVMYIKGPCESLMLSEACKLLPKDQKYRIFKISGRYQLDNTFNEEHHDASGKYVFKSKDNGVKYYHADKDSNTSQLQNIDLYYTPYQYKTRLYSFCSTLLDIAIENYQQIFNTIIGSYINHGYIDLEHATYKNIKTDIIHELDVIGVKGIQAENGLELKE